MLFRGPRTILASALLLALASEAAAQDASNRLPPASPAGTAALHLCTWVNGREAVSDIDRGALLSPACTAIDLSRNRPIPADELAGRFPGARLLATVAYAGTPKTLASDLSQQLSQIEDIPQSSLQALIIPADKANAADTVAAEWMGEALAVAPGDAVGAIVLWHAEPTALASLSETPAPQGKLVMIAFKHSEEDGNGDGVARITRLAYALPGQPVSSR